MEHINCPTIWAKGVRVFIFRINRFKHLHVCFIHLQLSLPNHGGIGWNVALSDDSAQVSDPSCRWLINNDMHKLTVPLQSLSNHWFLYRVNSVIGIGVGAGAYILSRFAVSPHPDEIIYISTHLLFTFFYTSSESFFCPPLHHTCNNWSFSGHTVCYKTEH